MKFIVVYDYETTGLDIPVIKGGTSEVIQIGAVALNFNSLKKVGEFSTMVNVLNPTVLDTDDVKQALQKNKKTKEEILAAPHPEIAWKNFVAWMTPFGGGAGKNENRPMAGGQNILGFDNYFTHQMCERYGPLYKKKQKLFNTRINYDTLQLWPWWLSNGEVSGYGMDTLRPWFGLPMEGAHDALKDAKDSAWLIARFLAFHRKIDTRKFKGAFSGTNPYE